ncbi:MAG: SpoIIIAH-like family protein, partial [Clostridia bacterium]
IELLTFMETELVLENLIKAKGISDAVVSLSTKNVNVIVKNNPEILKQSNDILSIVVGETDFVFSQVFVIPFEG